MNRSVNGLKAWAFGLLATVVCVPAAVAAEPAWPSQPIKFVVPYAAGGSSDTRARQLAQLLARSLGVPVVVDNKPGASGNIGTSQVALSKPDGYTIGLGNFAPMAVNKALYKLNFDPIKDLAPIALIERGPLVLGVNSKSPYTSLEAVVKIGKSEPVKLNYASTGAGSASHLGAELLRTLTGIQAAHVAYRGGAPAVNDLLAGNVDLYLELPSLMMPYAAGDASRLRLLAVSSEKRLASLPNVPTFKELGVPGMVMSNWFGVVAPAGTSPAIVKRLNDEINRALKDPGYSKTVEAQGGEVAGGTPTEFRDFIGRESERWAQLIHKQSIKVE